mgnify:CR=1 FL=1
MVARPSGVGGRLVVDAERASATALGPSVMALRAAQQQAITEARESAARREKEAAEAAEQRRAEQQAKALRVREEREEKAKRVREEAADRAKAKADAAAAAKASAAEPPADAGAEPTESEHFAEGDAVEARFEGGEDWFAGRISRVNADGTFEIAYDDGGRDSRLRARFVRREGGGKKKKTSRRDDSGTDTAGEDDFARGDKIEADYKGKGKMYAGEITRVHDDGTYNIRYDDGDEERYVEALSLIQSSEPTRPD